MGEECLMGPEVNFIFRAEKFAASVGVAFCFTADARALLGTHLPLEPFADRHELKGFPGSFEFYLLR